MNGNPCNCCENPPCNYAVEAQSKSGQGELCGTTGLTDPTTYFNTQSVKASTGNPDDSYLVVWSDAPDGYCGNTITPQAGYGTPPSGCVPESDSGNGNTHNGNHCKTTGEPISSIDLSGDENIGLVKTRAQGRYEAAEFTDSTYAIEYYQDAYTVFLSGTRYRIRHAPSATCYVKAWYRITTIPDGGDPVVGDWTEMYTWMGTGMPCLGGCTDGSDKCITSDWTTFDPPDAPGIITVEIFVSCNPLDSPPA